ncbi:MAG: FAD-dependent oxidoreductase [Candidatus Krumholzibacteriota bacterium]|nr:FAD-dependent oxidoreductase [Candidatus Krumholzibacteriota bacterium]
MSAKIGVYICECGPNIADNIEIDAIIDTLPSLEAFQNEELVVKRFKLLCSNEGKEYLEREIRENEYSHLVVAACSPRDHDSTFINICKKTNLNPYLYKMVNIREQCAWMIPDKEKATRKAIQYIRGAIGRVLKQSELFEKELDSNPDVLVIGGGISGIETALSLAGEKRKVYLVEKSAELGGKAAKFKKLLPRQGGSSDIIGKKIEEVIKDENIDIFTETELESAVGFFGNFEISLNCSRDDRSETEFTVGAIVAATGFELTDAAKLSQYKYKKDNEVYTSLEIEDMIKSEGKVTLRSGKEPESVGLIHCVGREEKGYCSQICCNYMLKLASFLRKQSDSIEIKDFYRDLCLPHQQDQDFFEEVRGGGTEFIRTADVKIKGTHIEYTEIDKKKNEADVDMVILSPAMEAGKGTENLAELLNIPLSETGFFKEEHQQLNPVETSIEGIFITGACRGPAGISESMLQAQAASGKIAARLIPGKKIVPEVKVSEILEDFCVGCQTCMEICPYGAIIFDGERGVCVVNEAVCRGCGNCAGSCPSGAIRAKHFTSPQIYREIIEAIR